MATSNFTFTTLSGTETAGWNSINALINNIDLQLNNSNRLVYMAGGTPTGGYTITWDSGNSRWSPGQVGAAAIANNAVELGTKTTGDYVASIAAAGSNEVSVTGSGEGAAATVRLADNTALRGAATVQTPPTYSGGSTGTTGRIADAKYVTDALAYATAGNITLTGDVTVTGGVATISNLAVDTAKIDNNAVTDDKLDFGAVEAAIDRDGGLDAARIINDTIGWEKLGSTSRGFGFAGFSDALGTGSNSTYPGRYFVASGNLVTDSTSDYTGYNPIVNCNNTSNIELSLATGVGSVGRTITIIGKGTGTVTVRPAAVNPATINGSTSNTYLLAAQYSVVTLLCINSNTWVITGDYI